MKNKSSEIFLINFPKSPIFALSYAEVTNTKYGFYSDPTIQDYSRAYGVTDFAIATGVLQITSELIEIFAANGANIPSWTMGCALEVLLRSPVSDNWRSLKSIIPASVIGWSNVDAFDGSYHGILPAMYISR